MTITAKDMETIDVGTIAAATRAATAEMMGLSEDAVATAFGTSNWGTIEEMIEREFTGSYRGYFPKCGMSMRCEVVIAEVFDLLAAAFEDPRRALRYGAPAETSLKPGGRSDG